MVWLLAKEMRLRARLTVFYRFRGRECFNGNEKIVKMGGRERGRRGGGGV